MLLIPYLPCYIIGFSIEGGATVLISTKGRYALRVMIDLAEHPSEGFVPLKVIADRQEISEKYLESIIKLLVRGSPSGGRPRQGGRLPSDPSAGVLHRGQHPAPDRRLSVSRSLPGAGGERMPPRQRVPHPAHVAEAGDPLKWLFRQHHPGRPDAGGEETI